MSYNYPLLLYRKPSVFSKPWSQKNLKKVQGSFSFFLWWLLLLLMGATERNSKQSSYLQKEKKNEKEGRKNWRGDEPCQGRRRSGQRPHKFQFARHHHHLTLPTPPPPKVLYSFSYFHKGRSFVRSCKVKIKNKLRI